MDSKKWTLSFSKAADKGLDKLDHPIKKRIIQFLENRVLPAKDPREYGKMLTGQLSGLWSYRVGDDRIIADIQDDKLVILVVQLDHRRQIYDL